MGRETSTKQECCLRGYDSLEDMPAYGERIIHLQEISVYPTERAIRESE